MIVIFTNKNLSIKKLTIYIFSIIYILYFLITSISLYAYSKFEFNRSKLLIDNSNTILSQQIGEIINNISDVSKYPLLTPQIDDLYDILYQKENYEIISYNYLRKLCEMMLIQNTSINGAYIYNLDGIGVSSNRNNFNETLKNSKSENWFTESLSNGSSTSLFANISTNNIFNSTSTTPENLIALTRKIPDLNTNKTIGILLVTISLDKFKTLLTTNLPFKSQVLSIYDSDNNLVVSSNEDFYIDTLNSTIDENFSIIKTISKKNSFFNFRTKVPYSDWTIINSIPSYELYKVNKLYLFFFITNLFFFLVLISILFMLFLKRIFNPIKTLVTNMSANNLEKNLNQELIYDKNDEIGLLFKSYNEMKSRINNLITINYKNKIEQKELELGQLQIQINPHFIYNTLESIHMMAEINNDLSTSKMAQYFGTIIRYSMNRKINTVTLDKELSIINNYIYLQKIRFDQTFIIENNVPSNLLNCEVIKMIIQPLIENAIYHGLSECNEYGKIIIQGKKIDQNLILTISDNGIGMNESTLNDLNDYINDKNNKFTGIALRNINRRLKLKYGDIYGLEIFSKENKGTQMILTLPYIIK